MATLWRKLHFLYYWLPPILWGLAVLAMSGDLGSDNNTLGLLKWLLSWFGALTLMEPDKINFYMRKSGHATAYGLMFFLWFRAFYAHGDFGPRRSLFYSLGICLFLASIDEGHQWFLSSRTGSIWDVLLDISGSILSGLITFAVWISRDYVASRPMMSFWRRPHLLSYWLPPLLWTLAMLVMARDVISVGSTMGPLKWFVSWFAIVDLFQLKILNFYLWKTGCFLAYGILYVLWFRAFQRHAGASLGGAFLLALGLCVLLFTINWGHQGLEGIWAASSWDNLLGLSGSCMAALITFAVMTPRNLVVPRSIRAGSKSWTSREPKRGGEAEPLGITTSFWRRPHVLNYWLPPVLWSLAVLTMPGGVFSVKSTLGPLKWFVSWFAIVDSYDLKILNVFLWKIGQVMAFGILFGLWFRALQIDAGASRGRACLYALGLCLLSSMLGRIYQAPGGIQIGGIWEVIIDMSGACLAALITRAMWTSRYRALTIPGIDLPPKT